MGRGQRFWERLAEEAELNGEPMPGQSIVEIVGDRRVLIENHLGVRCYSREKIIICVRQGSIHVCGNALELARMTREQLVIQGQIESVSLERKG